MRIAVLGATGRVGRPVVEQTLDRGHEVVTLVRSPQQYARPARGGVEVRQADATRPQEFPEPADVDVLVSALGISKGDGPGALPVGAGILVPTAGAA